MQDGKVRHIAASNFSAERLAKALEIQEREGFAKFVALQPEYNLVSRDKFEGELQDTVARHDLATVPYWSLAKGFLTGKYRPGVEVQSARAGAASKYLDEHGLAGPRGARRTGRNARDDGRRGGTGVARAAADGGGADRFGTHVGAAQRPAAAARPSN